MFGRDKMNGLFLLLFALVSLMYWGFIYPDHLIHKEQMQMFLFSQSYFFEHVAKQGGLSVYLGEFLVQFFCLKWIGPVIVTLLLVLVVLVGRQILRSVQNNSDFQFLSFIPGIGYWLLLTDEFYYISGVIAIQLALLSIWFYVSTVHFKNRILSSVFLLPALYWIAGGAYIISVISFIVFEIIHYSKKEKIRTLLFLTIIVAYIVVAILVPIIARQFLLFDTLLQSYLSEAFYKVRIFFPDGLKLLFISIPAMLLIQGVFKQITSIKTKALIQALAATFLILFLGFGLALSTDSTLERELKFDNLVYRQNWDDIIQEAEKRGTTGRTSQMAVTLALLNTGKLTEKLFHFNPQPTDLFLLYQRQGLTPLIANEPYFYLGLINFSQMLAVESFESTIDAKMPVRAVKRMAETYLITGQYEVAEKLLNYLKNTLFYRKWALNALDYLYHDDKVHTHPLWGRLRGNQPKEDFYFNGSRLDLALMYLLRSNIYNKPAYEYLMATFLLNKDLDAVINYLPLLQPLNYKTTPISLEEALVYIETLMPDMPGHLKEIPVSQRTRQELQSYARAFQEGSNNRALNLKKEFGNTYWYYIHFR